MEFKKIFVLLPALAVNLLACGGGEGNNAEDELVEGFPVAYVKRPFPLRDADNNNQIIQPDARNPLQFYEGSDLYIRKHASAQTQEQNITGAITGGDGDVRDVDVSYDGKKILFAMKEDPDIPNAAYQDQPKWNIWEYNIEQDKLRKVIEWDIFSEEGDDVAPHYLPDGRIIFSSTRQYGSKEFLLNEGKGIYKSLVDQENDHAMMLHVMDEDGTNIRQITYGLGRDMDPYVRGDGKVIFSRWDRYSGSDDINIYSVNPDGTQLELLFGAHSHFGFSGQVQYTQPREYPDGRVLTILRSNSDTFGGGDIGLIDTDHYGDTSRPTFNNAGISGSGLESLTKNQASSGNSPLLGGRYISVFPLWDGTGRSLVSWSPCRLMEGELAVPCTFEGLSNPDLVEADPIYSLYIYDPARDIKLPIFLPQEGDAITDVVAVQARDYPPQLEDTVYGNTEKTGILHIRSVYDYDGQTFNVRGASNVVIDSSNPVEEMLLEATPDDRQARFLRLIKPFVRPDRDDLDIQRVAFGPARNRDGLVEIIGYAPIEPDGSVRVRVPANAPFSFQIVDRNGRRIGEQKHFYWLTVRNGETLECAGCHNHGDGLPHGRSDAVYAINRGSQTVDGIFPGQNSAIVAEPNETMAETRTRINCITDPNCKGLNPSLDIVYEDIWPAVPDMARNFAYYYDGVTNPGGVFDFDTDETPTSLNCVNNWTWSDAGRCRSVINYVTHIDPLWSKTRMSQDGLTNFTCSQNGCHSPIAADGVTIQVPPGVNSAQVNLDNISINDEIDDPTRLKAYRELLVRDNMQELNMAGVLVDVLVDGDPILIPDPDNPGEFIFTGEFEQVPIPTTNPQPMFTGNARGSSFFNVFVPGDPNHYDAGAGEPILTPSEQKLISEWLDIGAQYYNNPYDVPN